MKTIITIGSLTLIALIFLLAIAGIVVQGKCATVVYTQVLSKDARYYSASATWIPAGTQVAHLWTVRDWELIRNGSRFGFIPSWMLGKFCAAQ